VTDGGVVYLLLLAANKPAEVAAVATAAGFDAVTVESRWGGAERLCVLRLTRRPRGWRGGGGGGGGVDAEADA